MINFQRKSSNYRVNSFTRVACFGMSHTNKMGRLETNLLTQKICQMESLKWRSKV